jgi:hypothetical protein
MKKCRLRGTFLDNLRQFFVVDCLDFEGWVNRQERLLHPAHEDVFDFMREVKVIVMTEDDFPTAMMGNVPRDINVVAKGLGQFVLAPTAAADESHRLDKGLPRRDQQAIGDPEGLFGVLGESVDFHFLRQFAAAGHRAAFECMDVFQSQLFGQGIVHSGGARVEIGVVTVDAKAGFESPFAEVFLHRVVIEDIRWRPENERVVRDDEVRMKLEGQRIDLVVVIEAKEDRFRFGGQFSAHEAPKSPGSRRRVG